eukprot:PLAT12506.3.p1 GENE.PLAT12506.3~~PLAT12506.3.p1  ORF type:complete len:484 (-),score=179.74 PLAT12506.3:128-1579(-)
MEAPLSDAAAAQLRKAASADEALAVLARLEAVAARGEADELLGLRAALIPVARAKLAEEPHVWSIDVRQAFGAILKKLAAAQAAAADSGSAAKEPVAASPTLADGSPLAADSLARKRSDESEEEHKHAAPAVAVHPREEEDAGALPAAVAADGGSAVTVPTLLRNLVLKQCWSTAVICAASMLFVLTAMFMSVRDSWLPTTFAMVWQTWITTQLLRSARPDIVSVDGNRVWRRCKARRCRQWTLLIWLRSGGCPLPPSPLQARIMLSSLRSYGISWMLHTAIVSVVMCTVNLPLGLLNLGCALALITTFQSFVVDAAEEKERDGSARFHRRPSSAVVVAVAGGGDVDSAERQQRRRSTAAAPASGDEERPTTLAKTRSSHQLCLVADIVGYLWRVASQFAETPVNAALNHQFEEQNMRHDNWSMSSITPSLSDKLQATLRHPEVPAEVVYVAIELHTYLLRRGSSLLPDVGQLRRSRLPELRA